MEDDFFFFFNVNYDYEDYVDEYYSEDFEVLVFEEEDDE